ncbi:hypothetical protein [Cecembia rubra]|uniref:SprT-like family protein n=1 Tax=Cecembia rubra TaxID=1485585 RepID=A0A2P8E0H0_9BACT|nr:hypothetical protein [Cecembia rubra]PSL02949.1 hypothetical protein CLV48_10858 [Cecembia rubra]
MYEINLSNKEIVLNSQFTDNLPDADPSKTVIQNILFVENKQNGRFDPVIARYYPADEYSVSKFEEISYNKIGAGWSGTVDIWTYDERYFVGFIIEDGQLIATKHPEGYQPDARKRKSTLQGENLDSTCRHVVSIYTVVTIVTAGNGSEISYHDETEVHMVCSGGTLYNDLDTNGTPIPRYNYDPYGGGWGGVSGEINYTPPSIPAPKIEIILSHQFKTNPYLRCLFDKLRENSYFESIASKFEGVSPDVHLILDLASFDPQFNGKAQWQGYGNPIIITMNSANLNNRSALEVARTMIHEMFHAEFYRAVKTNMPSSGDILFRDTFDQYVKTYMGTADQHHNLMADRYLDVMADILVDIHKKLDYEAFADAMKNVYPNGIPKSFYKSLAWEGLKDTMAYQLMEKITVQPPLKSPLQKMKEAQEFARYGLKTCN